MMESVLPAFLQCYYCPHSHSATPLNLGPGAANNSLLCGKYRRVLLGALVWGFCLKCNIQNNNNKRNKSLTCKWLCLAEPSNQIKWLFFHAHPDSLGICWL